MNKTTLKTILSDLKSQHRYRSRQIMTSGQGVRVHVMGQEMLNFTSNDYLGLAGHPKIAEAMIAAIKKYGVSSGASHLISGHSEAHEECEQAFAQFFNTERALLFSSGYMANIGVINALTDRHSLILQDKLNHASLIDAGKMSDAKGQRYRHNDTKQLELLLQKSAKQKLIVTDSVFSMDGDVAPLKKIAQLADHYKAELFVDEAHGFGVLGEHGEGLAVQENLSTKPWIMATCGKSLGTSGAVVAGSEEQIEFLIQKSRSYMYTTALPASIAAASTVALQLLKAADDKRSHLKVLISQLRTGLLSLGFKLVDSQTPIQALLVKDEAIALKMSQYLAQHNLFVQAIRPPTVASSRLRITLSADHQEQDISQLLDVLGRYS